MARVLMSQSWWKPMAVSQQLRVKSSVVTAIGASEPLVELDVEQNSTFTVPFARAKIGPFFQEPPQLGNQFTEDSTLQTYLKRHMPSQMIADIFPELERFGWRVATDIYALHRECELNPPRLEHYDAWGKRVDNIVTSPAWKQMKSVSAEEGLIAIAYERKYAEWSRLYQLAKLFLFAPSSGMYGCPLAMTDGAARTIEVMGRHDVLDDAFKHLISRNPDQFWTSGQWMTERKGGSDVAGGTQTVAVKQSDGSYKLYGYKWFSSATEADMTLTLARICDKHGHCTEGTKGLSMFYVRVRDDDGNLDNIEVQRLKDKLGTRALPTAELLLDGTRALRVSDEGRGVANIATMLTLTRLHNTIWSAAIMRRMVHLVRDYSMKRVCFGKTIKDHKLHVKNLASMEVETRAAMLLTFELGRLLGFEDCNKLSSVEQDILRLLTPLAKLYTAKQVIAVTSEGLECFGGLGYLEDTGLPSILRDSQVMPIWEGTTNVLSLDMLRAVQKSNGSVLVSFDKEVTRRLAHIRLMPAEELHDSINRVYQGLERTMTFAQQHPDKLELAARDFAFSLSRIYMGLLLLEQAAWTKADEDVLAANRWCQQDMMPVYHADNSGSYTTAVADGEYRLVFSGYKPPSKL